jgi:hypothetical protein
MPRDLCREVIRERLLPSDFFLAGCENYFFRPPVKKISRFYFERFDARESLHLFFAFVCDACHFEDGEGCYGLGTGRVRHSCGE